MVTQRTRWLVALSSAALILGSELPAQSPDAVRPFHLGIFGGGSGPVGEFAEAAAAGYHVGARLGIRSRRSPWGAHAEAQFHRFGGKGTLSAPAGSAPTRIIAFTANVDAEAPMTWGSFYATAGVGSYTRQVGFQAVSTGDGRGNSRNFVFGLNTGAGLTFVVGRYLGYVESRIHRTQGDEDDANPNARSAMFVPVSVGVRF